MLMSALFVAGAFAINGNIAKADTVQAVNNNAAKTSEVKQNAGQTTQAATAKPSKEQLKEIAMKQYNEGRLKSLIDYSNRAGEYYAPTVSVASTALFDADGKLFEHVGFDSEKHDWNQLKKAKVSINTYLNDAVNNAATLAKSRKTATNELKNVPVSMMDTQDVAIYGKKDLEKYRYVNDSKALDNIWNTIQNPYLATLLGARESIKDSDYSNEAANYSDKLAELVARNVRKDKNWVLANTDPSVIRLGTEGYNPENDTPILPYFVYNKELIKVDKNAYNRNHGKKVDESTSTTNKTQTTTNLKNEGSQVVSNNSTSKNNSSVSTDVKKNAATTTNSADKKNSEVKSNASVDKTQTSVETKNGQTTDAAKNSETPATTTSLVSKKASAKETVATTNVKSAANHVSALSNKTYANAATTNHAYTVNNGKTNNKASEKKLPQAGTDEKISLFASLAGLSIASLGLGALGADRKRKNN